MKNWKSLSDTSQLGNAIIRAELYQKNAKNVKDLKAALEELKRDSTTTYKF